MLQAGDEVILIGKDDVLERLQTERPG
jgi:K+/H+ antiporter YhaU regulatory subunit KhtT